MSTLEATTAVLSREENREALESRIRSEMFRRYHQMCESNITILAELKEGYWRAYGFEALKSFFDLVTIEVAKVSLETPIKPYIPRVSDQIGEPGGPKVSKKDCRAICEARRKAIALRKKRDAQERLAMSRYRNGRRSFPSLSYG